MPEKRIVAYDLVKQSLKYVLRVSSPEGTVGPLRRDYTSIYGDPFDPDLDAIRSGEVLETRRAVSLEPLEGESKSELAIRLRDYLETEWETAEARSQTLFMKDDIVGAYWDGQTWSKYTP